MWTLTHEELYKRRGWDSNPRVLSDASFQDWCIKPLCHPSKPCLYRETSGPNGPLVKRRTINSRDYSFTEASPWRRHGQARGVDSPSGARGFGLEEALQGQSAGRPVTVTMTF